ncbi:LOW QUALITY PROTEIN: membrane-bound lytic murein transglycosylase B [Vibrio sp. JCM 18905]|nr:LOW QUALITY PROTEIN: membrane-bound lytic murein transglycosylase B [Vibrio sp. JCM 18905]
MKKILATMLSVGVCTSAFASSEGFDEYLNKLRAEARDKGISEQVISAAFANVEYKPRAVKADRNQPEKKLTLDEYIPRAVPEWKVKQARQLYKEHYTELKRIGDEYGVQPRFIVALWGVESNFGKFTGNFKVIDALSTMAFEGRREEFFRKETMSALQILDQGHIELDNFKGSWAGAMGQCQFMPSSFLRFAADGNGMVKKTFGNLKRRICINRLFEQVRLGQIHLGGRQVKVPKGIDRSLEGRTAEKGKYLQEWSKLGITKYDGSPLPKLDEDIKAWLIMPDDENGRTYLVYNNYNVLMKWNRSYYFALAVSHLADRIKY